MKKFIKTTFATFSEKRLSTVAGAWVYYFLMSVIPLAFLLATAFGVFGINVLNDLVSRLPEEFRTSGQAIANAADNVSRSVTLLFVFTIIFSCTTLLNQMSKDADFIYGIRAREKQGVMRRIWAVVALSALFILFLIMALLFAFRKRLMPQTLTNGVSKMLLSIGAVSLVVLFCYAIIIVLFKYISPIKQKLGEFMLGGLFSLGVIVLGTLGLSVYLRYFSSYNALYGSLAGIVVFLLWAYIVMLGLVVGVIINKCAYERALNHDKNKSKSKSKTTKKIPVKPKSVKHA